MDRLIVVLSATIGDIIYYGNRKTGEINDFKINNISITKKNNDLIYEYYDMNGNYICNEKDLTRFKENNRKYIKIFKKVLDKTLRLLYNIQVLKIKKKTRR